MGFVTSFITSNRCQAQQAFYRARYCWFCSWVSIESIKIYWLLLLLLISISVKWDQKIVTSDWKCWPWPKLVIYVDAVTDNVAVAVVNVVTRSSDLRRDYDLARNCGELGVSNYEIGQECSQPLLHKLGPLLLQSVLPLQLQPPQPHPSHFLQIFFKNRPIVTLSWQQRPPSFQHGNCWKEFFVSRPEIGFFTTKEFLGTGVTTRQRGTTFWAPGTHAKKWSSHHTPSPALVLEYNEGGEGEGRDENTLRLWNLSNPGIFLWNKNRQNSGVVKQSEATLIRHSERDWKRRRRRRRRRRRLIVQICHICRPKKCSHAVATST